MHVLFVSDWFTMPVTLVGGALLASGLALRIAALGIIPGNRKPSTGMAWLLLVLLSPIVGFVAFLFFGSAHLDRRRHERQRRVVSEIRARTQGAPGLLDSEDWPAYVRSVVELNTNLGSLPLMHYNHVEVLDDYLETIATMTRAIEGAQRFVHIEFYIMAWDEVTGPLFRALMDATERGVRVCLLFDHLGSRGIPGYRGMVKRLNASDIDWHPMMPFKPLKGKIRRPDLRNHRKLLVVDGEIGFTGSLNLTEPGYNKPRNHRDGREWVELMVSLRGQVVAALEAVFASDWYAETGELLDVDVRPAPDLALTPETVTEVPCQLVPSGPGYIAENNLRLFTSLVYAATERLSLTSPYFVPDESLLYAVTTAARRGVAVELFVNEQSDQFMVGHAQSSYYRALLDAGVTVRLYPAPLVLHSKHFSVDDRVAVVGPATWTCAPSGSTTRSPCCCSVRTSCDGSGTWRTPTGRSRGH